MCSEPKLKVGVEWVTKGQTVSQASNSVAGIARYRVSSCLFPDNHFTEFMLAGLCMRELSSSLLRSVMRH